MDSRNIRVAVGGLLAAAGVVVLVTSLGDWIGPTGVDVEADSEVPGSERDPARLVTPEERREGAASVADGFQASAPPNEREALVRDTPAVEAAPKHVPEAPVPYVEGRVIDALGRPRAGVQVHARVNPKPVARDTSGGELQGGESGLLEWGDSKPFEASIGRPNPLEVPILEDGNSIVIIPSSGLSDFGRFGSDPMDRLRPKAAVTDEQGHFEMVDLPSDRTGALIFGHDLYRGSLPETPLVSGQFFYELELQNYPEVESRVTLDVVDADGGAPLEALQAEFQFEGRVPGGPGGPQPKPVAEGMTVEGSHIEFARVTPGRWSAWVRAKESLPARIEFVVAPSGVDQWFPADLRRLEGSHWSSLRAGVATDEDPATLPEPSVERGLEEMVAEQPRSFGQGGNNLWLAHTFRFPRNQDLAGAFLTVRLEGYGGMATNDSLNLEYDGQSWTWGTHIKNIPGAEGWSQGKKATLRIDLADLPVNVRGVTSLMPNLADGELDIFVQDDTVVHSVDLELVAR